MYIFRRDYVDFWFGGPSAYNNILYLLYNIN